MTARTPFPILPRPFRLASLAARPAAFGLALLAAAPASALRVAKADFPRFAGSFDCRWNGEECPGSADGFVQAGLAGTDNPDPAAPELAADGKVVLGFLEGKPFSWSRYAVDFPSARSKWIVLNELSSGDQNNVFLTLWKSAGDSIEFVKAYPKALPVELGETHVHAHAVLPDKSLLLILKGEGADAGVTLQDYRFLRVKAPDQVSEAGRRTNRSEVPVRKILEKINNDEPVEPVTDSALACEIVKGRRAPSGGPLIRFTTTRISVLYTKAGPQETPLETTQETWDIWKSLRGAK